MVEIKSKFKAGDFITHVTANVSVEVEKVNKHFYYLIENTSTLYRFALEKGYVESFYIINKNKQTNKEIEEWLK
jgi:hypothetical protein